jgi:hypothetical protein
MPVWAIVLIAISILVALGVIAFFVRKKMIAEMQ